VFRLESKSISRGNSQSAVASISYRSGELLHDEKLGKSFDYSRKQGISHTEIILPTNADIKYQDRATLWNAVEKKETRINSELAREYLLTLPTEINNKQQIELVKSFAQKHLVDKGLAVDLCFHNLDRENPHCHLVSTTRSFNKNGELDKKERFIKDRSFLIGIRKEWEKTLNLEFELSGIDKRVTADSLMKQGLDLKPLNSIATSKGNIKKQIESIKEENAKRLLKNPSQVATALTHTKATFTDKDLKGFLKRYVAEDKIKDCYMAVFKNENTLLLSKEKREFTSSEYLLVETKLLNSVDKLNTEDLSKKVSIESLKNTSEELTLFEEQKVALAYATKTDSNIKNIQGFAGAGKSNTLKAIADVYTKNGFTNRGLALSGVIADNLAKDCKISNSSTIASFLINYEKGNEKIDDKTVFYLDEASLVDTRSYQKILAVVEKHNAKIINVGDDNQLQAIGAGGAFRKIVENTHDITLSDIRRQKEPKDKKATLDFSTGNTKRALEHYQSKGAIKFHDNKTKLISEISNNYLQDRKELEPYQTSLILAFRKDDVKQLNERIHKELKANGELGKSTIIKGVEYSENDRFVFLENNKQLGVKNGTIGTIEKIQGDEFQIRLDSDRNEPITRVNFNVKDYDKFSQAYALTIHKSQGVTVDKAQVLLDKGANSSLALVGCSRHKTDLKIHCAKKSLDSPNGLDNFEQLAKACQKKALKEMVSDRLDKLSSKIFTKENTDKIQEFAKKDKAIESTKDIIEKLKAQKELEAKTKRAVKVAQSLKYDLGRYQANKNVFVKIKATRERLNNKSFDSAKWEQNEANKKEIKATIHKNLKIYDSCDLLKKACKDIGIDKQINNYKLDHQKEIQKIADIQRKKELSKTRSYSRSFERGGMER